MTTAPRLHSEASMPFEAGERPHTNGLHVDAESYTSINSESSDTSTLQSSLPHTSLPSRLDTRELLSTLGITPPGQVPRPYTRPRQSSSPDYTTETETNLGNSVDLNTTAIKGSGQYSSEGERNMLVKMPYADYDPHAPATEGRVPNMTGHIAGTLSSSSSESNHGGHQYIDVNELGGHVRKEIPGMSGRLNINITNKSSTPVQVGRGNVMQVHQGHNQTSHVTSTNPPPRKKVELKIPKRVVTDDDIDLLARHVGDSWRPLGRRLGYSDGELDTYRHDYHLDGLQEIIRQMMVAWRQRLGPEAYIRVIVGHLLAIKRPDVAKLFNSDN